MNDLSKGEERQIVFISKATPGDDEFVLWLAPRLEAAGYQVFADILNLQPGDRWRKEITSTLQNKAIKMLLCCQDSTLDKNGVQEEISIAEDVAKLLKDPRLIIPLRLQPFKKLFGIGGLQYIDFEKSWANGLKVLLDTLEKQEVPRQKDRAQINPSWESYKQRLSIKIEESPEPLTSNWLHIMEIPDKIYYYTPTGSLDHSALQRACETFAHPAQMHLRGFFSFADIEEVNDAFISAGKFSIHAELPLLEFIQQGSQSLDIKQREASNMITSMFRQAWENHCRKKALFEYTYSTGQAGFHVSENQTTIGKKIPWGRQGERRSSMLRNIAKGKVWQYGISAFPSFWPYPHFRIKSRVLFAELNDNKAGAVFEEARQQHRLRRGICKGWRNKQWHGRLMAFLELLSGESSYIDLPLSSSAFIRLDAGPIRFTAPVTTVLPTEMSEDDEELDISTLGNVDFEEVG
jgi:hypothetical protein